MQSRRLARFSALAFALAIMVVVHSGAAGVSAANQQALDSEALGLTRDQLEEIWGAATEPVDVPGQPGTDEMFLYGAEDAMTYVSYRELNGEQIAVFVELAWLGDGVSQQVSTQTIERLLPADAILTELYIAPATPDGPIALSIYRYTSESLADAYDDTLAAEILVIEQHAWNDAAGSSTITSFSLMIRERTQLTN